MKKNILALIFIVLINKLNAELNNSGMTFLQIPAAAQTAATMGVFTQTYHSPLSVFENPIGLKSPETALSFSHHFWFADISTDALAVSFPVRKSSLGFGLKMVRIPGVEIRKISSDEPLASVEPQYMTAVAAYTWSPVPKFSIGVSSKYIYEHLYTFTDHGAAFDLAVCWNAPSQLDMSFMLQNVGVLKSDKNQNALPATINIGLVRPELFEGEFLNAAIGLNLGSNLVSKEAFAEVGADINYNSILSLRGGFIHTGSLNKESVGIGLKLKTFIFDYAYMFMPEGLGNPHIITISFLPK